MTQVKLWQIIGQESNALIFSDAAGNLTTIAAGGKDQMLVIGEDGTPKWIDNAALATALQAQTDATNALATAKAYTEAQIAALVDNAPVALNTLNELALKLNGEDSAINALLLQVDGKADKTEVTAHIAQAKQDVAADSKAYTDSAIGTINAGIAAQIGQAKSDTLTAAAADATFKASGAQAGAIQAANAFTTQSVANAVAASAGDATTKSDAAKAGAISEANTHTDNVVAAALTSATTDATTKADAAKAGAINASATDASNKVSTLRDSIPESFVVEGTSTACYVASSKDLNKDDAMNKGIVVMDAFSEVTSAKVSDSDNTLDAKLLFVNGMAESEEWAASKTESGSLVIRFSGKLADHVFDGSENAIMLLAEYKSYNAITLKS